MSISLVEYAPGVTGEQYLAKHKEDNSGVPGIIERSDVTVAGHPAYRAVYVWEPEKGATPDRLSYYIAGARGVFQVFCTVKSADDFAKYLPIYEQTVQSIQID